MCKEKEQEENKEKKEIERLKDYEWLEKRFMERR